MLGTSTIAAFVLIPRDRNEVQAVQATRAATNAFLDSYPGGHETTMTELEAVIDWWLAQ